uniref:Uncharacterized protein n=1 Tax=Glossina morsitans morsitans TaxID=37546 RepID=A0A1B0GFT4_GLOMM
MSHLTKTQRVSTISLAFSITGRQQHARYFNLSSVYIVQSIDNVLLVCAYGTEMIRLVNGNEIEMKFKTRQKQTIFQSTDVSVALTDYPWYDGSIYYQRMLPFPIARAQRPAQLLGYKFFVVSMECFQSVSRYRHRLRFRYLFIYSLFIIPVATDNVLSIIRFD